MPKIYSRLSQLLFVFGLVLFSQACNLINPTEKVPTYIHIDSFIFDGNSSYFPDATKSHQITSVWAYYNGIEIGQFDLPATFPVITNSDTSTGLLQLAPGIEVDGQNNLTGIYPFFQYDAYTFKAQPGKIINYTPRTSYFTDTKIISIANFDLGRTGFGALTGTIPIVLDHDPSDVFEGAGSGSITLTNVGDSSIDSTSTPFVIPSGPAYIELNYKSDIPFYLGLQTNLSTLISSAPFYLAGISPSSTWKKFYFYLTDFAGEYKGTNYNLYIRAAVPSGQSGGKILLDNIQLVTF